MVTLYLFSTSLIMIGSVFSLGSLALWTSGGWQVLDSPVRWTLLIVGPLAFFLGILLVWVTGLISKVPVIT